MVRLKQKRGGILTSLITGTELEQNNTQENLKTIKIKHQYGKRKSSVVLVCT